MSEETEVPEAEIPEVDAPDIVDGDPVEAAEPEDDLSTEERARTHGWKNLEEWTAAGNAPEDHVDENTFMEGVDNRLPFMASSLRTMEKKYASLEKKFDRQQRFQDQNAEIIREEEKRKANERLEKAIAEMDEDGIRSAVADKERAATPPPPENDNADVIADFASRNSWYNTDLALTAMAQSLSGMVANEKPHLSPEQNLEEVERRMAQYTSKPKPRPKSCRKRAPSRTCKTHGI